MSSLALAMNKGAFEGGLFILSCGIFKLWMSKRTNNTNKTYYHIESERYNERILDPEDTSRKYNVYPDEKIVVRFLH